MKIYKGKKAQNKINDFIFRLTSLTLGQCMALYELGYHIEFLKNGAFKIVNSK